MLASVDPGVRHSAVALWDNGELRTAYLIDLGDKPRERAQGWRKMAQLVRESLPTGDHELVLEIPQVYREAANKGRNPNDLIDLAGVQGAIAGLCGPVVWSPLPRQWKGTAPKRVSEMRVDAKLSDAEKARVRWPIASLKHNVIDAIHLGLVYLKR